MTRMARTRASISVGSCSILAQAGGGIPAAKATLKAAKGTTVPSSMQRSVPATHAARSAAQSALALASPRLLQLMSDTILQRRKGEG